MNWITVIWSAITGICLTLAGVHFLVWLRSRGLWANLLFSIAAASAAACAVFELVLMHSQTPAEYGEVLRWLNVPVNLELIEALAQEEDESLWYSRKLSANSFLGTLDQRNELTVEDLWLPAKGCFILKT